MIEKFIHISAEKARELLERAKGKEHTKSGTDCRVSFVDDYAILKSNHIKLRNIETFDENLVYLDNLIESLIELKQKGVGVIPILGYCYDPNSHDGEGYIIQPSAKGAELYDDSIMMPLYVYGQGNEISEDCASYVLARTKTISEIPQVHFDKFVHDIIAIDEKDILIDFFGRSNFFYDSEAGFQFIDLNAHNDYHYGLMERRQPVEKIVATFAFTPCHYSSQSKYLNNIALSDESLSIFSAEELSQIAACNRIAFKKCRAALKHNGISDEEVEPILEKLKIYGLM